MSQAGTAKTKDAQTGQVSFIRMAEDVFSVTSDQALIVYAKLRSFMSEDAELGRLLQTAQEGRLNLDLDGLFERVRTLMLGTNVTSIVRSVLLPLAGGGLAAAALGMTGASAIFVAALVAALIALCMYPGTLAKIADTLQRVMDDIFRPNLWD